MDSFEKAFLKVINATMWLIGLLAGFFVLRVGLEVLGFLAGSMAGTVLFLIGMFFWFERRYKITRK